MKARELESKKCKLPGISYDNEQGRGVPSSSPGLSHRTMRVCLVDMAMKRHRYALAKGTVLVNQWKGHSVGVDQCRIRMGLVLTGVGNKIVGLVSTRLCIWRRNGNRSVFPPRVGTFPKGLCMRYMDPEAVVGCEDGTARIFDMYSKKCSQILKWDSGTLSPAVPISNALEINHMLVIRGRPVNYGRFFPREYKPVWFILWSTCDHSKTCQSHRDKDIVLQPFIQGFIFRVNHRLCIFLDLWMMKLLWEEKVSTNVIYSMHDFQNDTSTLVVGGIDGILRILDQNTGEILSSCSMDQSNAIPTRNKSLHGAVERRKVKRLVEDADIDGILRTTRPPIRCLAVGMKKVVTTHNDSYIRVWRFN